MMTAAEAKVCRKSLQEEIAELETQLADARRNLAIERAMRGTDAAMELLSANLEEHNWELKGNLRAPNFQRWLSVQVMNLLDHWDTENNLTWTHGLNSVDEWTITITRGGRPTPATQRDEAYARIDALEAENRELRITCAVLMGGDGKAR